MLINNFQEKEINMNMEAMTIWEVVITLARHMEYNQRIRVKMES